MNYTAMSKPSRALASAAILLAATALAGNPALALESDREKPIQVSADGGELDARTGFTRFTGSVQIQQGTLEVNADSANVYTEDGEITRILLKGEPATWHQQLESRKWMRAEASEIDYNRTEQTILLIGNAYVDHPQGEMSGDRFTYDLEAEKLRGASDTGGRIQMRLEPDVVDSGIGPDNRPDVSDPAAESDTGTQPGATAEPQATPESDGDSGDGNESGDSGTTGDSGEPSATTNAPDSAMEATADDAQGDAARSAPAAEAGSGGDDKGAAEGEGNGDGKPQTGSETAAGDSADTEDEDGGRAADNGGAR